jgi:hypothetical protein
MMRYLLTFLLPALLCGGCDVMKYVGYLVAPDLEKSIEPEFAGLPGKTVAVAVFVDQSTQYEFPRLRYELGLAINDALEKNVKDLRAVSPARVVKYQDEHPLWEVRPKGQIAQALGVDYVLYVAIMEFATREPGSMHLHRGRAKAHAALYSSSGPADASRVWSAERIEVLFPPEGGVGVLSEDDQQIRLTTQQMLADALAKKFYKHKEKSK